MAANSHAKHLEPVAADYPNANMRMSAEARADVNDFAGAAKAISLMTKVGLVEGGKKKYVLAPGLVKRRAEESAPFRRDAAAQAASE